MYYRGNAQPPLPVSTDTYFKLKSERGGPSGSFEFPMCVRVCVAWRGGPPGGRMGGEGLSVVASRRVRPAGVGGFHEEGF